MEADLERLQLQLVQAQPPIDDMAGIFEASGFEIEAYRKPGEP